MRFLIDRCAGHLLAVALRADGHDVLEAAELGPDPGDGALLKTAAEEHRVLVTMDKDFGALVYLHRASHAGLMRLPHVPAPQRLVLVRAVLSRHADALASGGVVTVRGGRIRVSAT